MTIKDFRRIVLSLPQAVESAHMGHPDFRVNGKIFATIAKPDEGLAMVKLKPDQQKEYVQSQPTVFTPCQGAWGRSGCTYVRLKAVKAATLRSAIFLAWRNLVPDEVAEQSEDAD